MFNKKKHSNFKFSKYFNQHDIDEMLLSEK